MEKFTPLAKILHCRRHWRHWQISPLLAAFRRINFPKGSPIFAVPTSKADDNSRLRNTSEIWEVPNSPPSAPCRLSGLREASQLTLITHWSSSALDLATEYRGWLRTHVEGKKKDEVKACQYCKQQSHQSYSQKYISTTGGHENDFWKFQKLSKF